MPGHARVQGHGGDKQAVEPRVNLRLLITQFQPARKEGLRLFRINVRGTIGGNHQPHGQQIYLRVAGPFRSYLYGSTDLVSALVFLDRKVSCQLNHYNNIKALAYGSYN